MPAARHRPVRGRPAPQRHVVPQPAGTPGRAAGQDGPAGIQVQLGIVRARDLDKQGEVGVTRAGLSVLYIIAVLLRLNTMYEFMQVAIN